MRAMLPCQFAVMLALCGLSGALAEEIGPAGRKVPGVRLVLKNGKTLECVAIPEQDVPGKRAVKTAGIPVSMIESSSILKEEPIEIQESAAYSPEEIYQRLILNTPPGTRDPAAHVEIARRCAELGLYEKAVTHLDSAVLIDNRFQERIAATRADYVRRGVEAQAAQLFQQLQLQQGAGDFLAALKTLDKLEKTFPNSDLRSRWQALRPELEAHYLPEVARQVTAHCYGIADDLIQQRLATKIKVNELGNAVPAIPGKAGADDGRHDGSR